MSSKYDFLLIDFLIDQTYVTLFFLYCTWDIQYKMLIILLTFW